MKSFRRCLMLGMLLLVINTLTSAQTDSINSFTSQSKMYPKHEIGVSYGMLPIIGVFYGGNYDDVYPAYENQIIKLGSISTRFRISINPIHRLDFNFSWAVYEHTLEVRQSGIYKNNNVHHFAFQLGYSICFFSKNAISLYSSLYGGVVVSDLGRMAIINQSTGEIMGYDLDNICLLHPAFHITFLGLQLGKKNAFNIELGYGTQGEIKLGYNYYF